jgi:hypothetical protein
VVGPVACLSIPALGFGWFNLKLKVTPRGGLIERQAKKMFYKLPYTFFYKASVDYEQNI